MGVTSSNKLWAKYVTATYTALNNEFIVATANSFTVNLPVQPAPGSGSQSFGPATQSTVVGTTGPQAPPVPQFANMNVIVRNNGSGTVTVKTTDGSTIDGIAGGTGAVLAQYRGVNLQLDKAGNWVCIEGVHT